MDQNKIEQLKSDIGLDRYEHSIRVAKQAEKLAKLYGVDEKKAYKAGLLHDCGKLLERELMLKKARKFDIIINELMFDNPELVHSHLGSFLAEEIYAVEDRDILNSIKYHTTGREDMSCLEKIIFIADFIEPERNFKAAEEVRKIAYVDLNKSIIMALDYTIKFLIDKEKTISVRSIEARNYLKLDEKRFNI